MSLAALLMVLISRVILTMASPQRPVLCPPICQCSSEYYVYCQATSLLDHQLADVISQVSPTAVLLDLSSNHIARIPANTFSSLPNLEYLNLAANNITELSTDAFRGLYKLRELTLNQNRITVLKNGCFQDLTSLMELNIGNNLIHSIGSSVFKEMSRVDKLHLENNRIAGLSPNHFSGLTNLKFLNLSHNFLTNITGSVFAGLRSVKILLLTDNNLAYFSVDAFSGLTNLEQLMLDRNNISDIVFIYGNDFYLSINYVSLASNYIVAVPSHVFPHNINLRTIDLSCNAIRRIGGHAFSNLHLDYLKLERNNISEINTFMFRDAKRISNLNLGHNRIKDIMTGSFDSIRDNIIDLNLSYNKLTNMHPGMFRGMRRLIVFNLAANGICDIDQGAFKDLEALQELNLSRNLFTMLSSTMISGPRGLRKLLIVCNPIQRLSGFSYQNVDDRMFIETNSTMITSTASSVVITWPYKDGTQLYWSLSIHCVNYMACEVPPYTSILRPYVTQVTVTGLKPGAEYFICVLPVFLSSDVNISQCVQVRTQMDTMNGSRHLTDQDALAANSSSTSSLPSSRISLSKCTLLLICVWLVHRLTN